MHSIQRTNIVIANSNILQMDKRHTQNFLKFDWPCNVTFPFMSQEYSKVYLILTCCSQGFDWYKLMLCTIVQCNLDHTFYYHTFYCGRPIAFSRHTVLFPLAVIRLVSVLFRYREYNILYVNCIPSNVQILICFDTELQHFL